MTWPIDIANLSRNDRRLQECIEDRALKTSSLEVENARLRAEVKDLREALATLRTAHAAASTRLLLSETIVAQLTTDAMRSPLWGLSRWVKYGPVADEIAAYETGVPR